MDEIEMDLKLVTDRYIDRDRESMIEGNGRE